MNAGFRTLLELLNPPEAAAPRLRPGAIAVGTAARLYCERRRRDRWFGPRMFFEPSWDILLYLFDAYESGEPSVPLTRLFRLDLAVSCESVDRWLDLLVANRLVAIVDDASERSVHLTIFGIVTLTGYLQDVAGLPALFSGTDPAAV